MVDDAIIDKVSWPGLDNAAAFEAAYNNLMDFVYKSLKLDGDVEKTQPQSTTAAIGSFRHIRRKAVRQVHVVAAMEFLRCLQDDNGRIPDGAAAEGVGSATDVARILFV